MSYIGVCQVNLGLQLSTGKGSIWPMPPGANEAFSRVLIDKALEFSGWNLLNPKEVCFEMSFADKRADYVLGGQRGPLCVLEAKREDVDPYDAKEKTRG